MNVITRHASGTAAWPTEEEQSPRGWRGLLPGIRDGHPARRLGVTALVAAAVAITGITAAVATATRGGPRTVCCPGRG